MKKKIAMLKRWMMILSRKTSVALKQGVGKAYCKDSIAGYYNDLTGKICETTQLDEEGIPITIIAGNEIVYFPIAIFQYGLGCYDKYLLTKDEKYKEMFIATVLWAKKKLKDDGSWDCFSALKSELYNVSSMCQAEGASLLYRAFVETRDEELRCMANKAIDFMLKPFTDGGTSFYEDDFLFFEEYPQEKRRTVLNGWIFSIFGLLDASIMNKGVYDELLEKAVDTLEQNLCRYDLEYWSKYDLDGNIASPAYNDLHACQLLVLSDIFANDTFLLYANKFMSYQDNKKYKNKAIFLKMLQKLFTSSDIVVIK